jgi:hypothetical protein
VGDAPDGGSMTAARAGREAETATRYVGFCAICEEDHKLTPAMTLVHHGYKRPGDGSIYGDCLCVHKAPYELSAEPLVKYRAMLERDLTRAKKRLAEFEANAVHYLEVTNVNWRTRLPETMSYSRYVSNEWVRQDVFDKNKRDIERDVNSLVCEMARIAKWIDAWVKKPVRTLEEDRAEKKRVADAARAEKQATRDEKKRIADAKKAEVAKKHADNLREIEHLARILVVGMSEPREVRYAGKWRRDWKKLGKMLMKERCWSYDHKQETMFEEYTLVHLVALKLAEDRRGNPTRGGDRFIVAYYGVDHLTMP